MVRVGWNSWQANYRNCMVTPDSSGLIAFDERDDVFW